MAIFYLDFENGNDALDGTTFANRWKSITNGATAARIAPGDEIRIMGSPAPTSLGINGTWTSGELAGTRAISGATNTTPISITDLLHVYNTGDTVVITNVGGNTNANGTWEITVTGPNTYTLNGSAGNANYTSGGQSRLRNNTRIMLASPVTQNIASTGPGRAAWTANANVTTALSTTTKEGYQSDEIAISSSFTTGLAAYWPPPSTLDLSGYQQVSFWIRQSSGTLGAAGDVDLRLCSDNAGVTAVDTISIPSVGATNRWMPVTVDLGTALGSSIQSIALYVNTDNGAQTFLLSNIIACRASNAPDSLTLTSLIGKNTTGETWWGIQSINGTRVMLDADTNASPTSTNVRGYYGTSETVETWKRETIKLGPAPTSTTTLQITQDSGSDGNSITYSGGWDRTAMTTQNLETWLDGVNGFGVFAINGPHLTIEKLAFVRLWYIETQQDATDDELSFIAVNNCSNPSSNTGAMWFTSNLRVITLRIGHSVGNRGNSIGLSSGVEVIIDHYIASNGLTAIYTWTANLPLSVIGKGAGIGAVANNSTGLQRMHGKVQDITFELNSVSDVNQGSFGSDYWQGTFINCLFNSTNEISIGNLGVFAAKAFSHKHDQTADNHKIFEFGALVSSATDQRKTASGISWKIQPTSTSRSASWPIILPLAKVACAANSLVTVKAWMRRSDTGLTMRLVCKGGQIAGVDNDVVDAMTAAADTWAEQTITFTPTETGVVEITAEAWGGITYSGWVDDMTISQA